jgi:hypothetical protein
LCCMAVPLDGGLADTRDEAALCYGPFTTALNAVAFRELSVHDPCYQQFLRTVEIAPIAEEYIRRETSPDGGVWTIFEAGAGRGWNLTNRYRYELTSWLNKLNVHTDILWKGFLTRDKTPAADHESRLMTATQQVVRYATPEPLDRPIESLTERWGPVELRDEYSVAVRHVSGAHLVVLTSDMCDALRVTKLTALDFCPLRGDKRCVADVTIGSLDGTERVYQ